jgi:hypothetical protein
MGGPCIPNAAGAMGRAAHARCWVMAEIRLVVLKSKKRDWRQDDRMDRIILSWPESCKSSSSCLIFQYQFGCHMAMNTFYEFILEWTVDVLNLCKSVSPVYLRWCWFIEQIRALLLDGEVFEFVPDFPDKTSARARRPWRWRTTPPRPVPPA